MAKSLLLPAQQGCLESKPLIMEGPFPFRGGKGESFAEFFNLPRLDELRRAFSF